MVEDILGFFDEFSKNYENEIFNKSLGTKYLSNVEVQFVLNYCPVKKGDKILDIGIGTGRLAKLLANKGAIVEGVDVSQGMMKEAKKKMKRMRVNFKVADVGKKVPYPDNTFDYVICIRVLKYISTWKKTISEISRVLKKDGVFILTIPNKLSVARFGLKGTKYFLFEPKIVKEFLEKNKLELTEVVATSRIPFPVWQKVNNKSVLYILKSLERLMFITLPSTFLSRSVLIASKKRLEDEV
jgi:ubiquinone/menaquinone biosynthesis C-methylase UbiE